MSKLTLDDVLKSKIYVKDNAAVSFQSPAAYIEPFLETLKNINGIEYEVGVSGTIANKNAEDNKLNEAFARIKVEAKLPREYNIEEHDSVIGMVYGLDTQKPVMKIYSGRNAWACTNLCIFRADHIHQVELMQGIDTIYEKSKVYAEQVTDHITSFGQRLKELKTTEHSGSDIDRVIGALLRKGIQNKQVGISHISSAAQALYDKSSVYAIRNGVTTQWNIMSALTQYVTDKVDIVDKCTKTLYVANLFDNLNYN